MQSQTVSGFALVRDNQNKQATKQMTKHNGQIDRRASVLVPDYFGEVLDGAMNSSGPHITQDLFILLSEPAIIQLRRIETRRQANP